MPGDFPLQYSPSPPLPPNNNYPLLINTNQPVRVGVRILYKVLHEVQIVKIPFCDQLFSDQVCSKMLQELNCTMTDNIFEFWGKIS